MIKNRISSSGQVITLASGQVYTLKDSEVLVNGVILKKRDLEISLYGIGSNSNQDNVRVGIRKRDGLKAFPAFESKYDEWEVDGVQQPSLADCIENINTSIYWIEGIGGGAVYDLQDNVATSKSFSLTEDAIPKTTIDLSSFVVFSDLFSDNFAIGTHENIIGTYQYNVTKTLSYIDGVPDSDFASGLVTLPAPDGSFNRFDLLVVDTNDNFTFVQGTASATPSPPDYDRTQYAVIAPVLVETGTTQPTPVVEEIIYDENTGTAGGEFDGTPSGASVILNSNEQAQNGSVSVKFNAVANGDNVVFLHDSVFVGADLSVLSFRVWVDSGNPRLRLQLRNSSTLEISSTVTVRSGTYGFDTGVTGSWQTIAIDKSDFNTSDFDELVITQDRNGNPTFYIDNIKFQTGLSNNSGLIPEYRFNDDTINNKLQLLKNGEIVSEFDYSTFIGLYELNKYNEDLSSQIDDVTQVFTTDNNFITNTTRVYLNGQKQVLGVDYTETAINEITFSSITPISTDELEVSYTRSIGSLTPELIPIEDDGIEIVGNPIAINFTGATEVTNVGGVATVNVPIRKRNIYTDNVTGSINLDMSQYIRFDLTLTGNTQINLSNITKDSDCNGIYVFLAGFTLTFNSMFTPFENSEDITGATLIHITFDVLDDTPASEDIRYYATVVEA